MLVTLRILFLLMIIIETSLMTFVFAKKSKKTVIVNMFILYLSVNSLWFITQLLIISPMASNNNIIIFLRIKSIFWLLPTFTYLLFILQLTKTKVSKYIYILGLITLILILFSLTTNNVIDSYTIKDSLYYYNSNKLTMVIPSLNIIPMFIIYFTLIKKYNKHIDYTKSYLVLFYLSLFSFLIVPLSHLSDLTLSFVIPIWSFINSVVTFFVVRKLFLSVDYEEFTNELFSNVHDGILITNKENQIIVTNKLAESIISNVLKNDTILLQASEIFEDYDSDEVYKNKIFKFKNLQNEVMLSQSLISNKLSEFKSIIIIKDLSSERLLQEELIRNQKLQSISVFAGGIAHDFGNILTAILGNITYLKMKLNSQDDEVNNSIKDTESIILQAKNLTKQLLDYTKTNQAKNEKNITVDTIIKSSVSLALSGSSILVDQKIESNLYKVYGDKAQLEQVFNNLLINAKQSIKERGKISIKIKKILIENKYIQFIEPGKYLEIIIEDNGTGIPKDKLHKIFTPYFTTKKAGNGLGLAIVSSIIKNHNGYINVESTLNKGTKFTIYLPASIKDDVKSKIDDIKIKEKKKKPTTNTKVLIMDDDEMILKITEKILKVLDYDVVCAKNGTEVLEYLKDATSNISTYILDLTIPGDMGGRELAPRIKEIDPDCTIIVSSGYSNKDEVINYKDYNFDDRLIKPYTIEELKAILGRN